MPTELRAARFVGASQRDQDLLLSIVEKVGRIEGALDALAGVPSDIARLTEKVSQLESSGVRAVGLRNALVGGGIGTVLTGAALALRAAWASISTPHR